MTTAFIGQPVSRVDGRQKVTGTATYAAEFDVPGLAHGAIVRSTVASGGIASIDSTAAEGALGVVAVLTHRNAPQLAYRAHKGAVDPDIGERLHVMSGRSGEPSRAADRTCDRRNPRTGHPRRDAGARHLRT
jgi:xanthine dehydrogenase YagR molybdenum-binding subunit